MGVFDTTKRSVAIPLLAACLFSALSSSAVAGNFNYQFKAGDISGQVDLLTAERVQVSLSFMTTATANDPNPPVYVTMFIYDLLNDQLLGSADGYVPRSDVEGTYNTGFHLNTDTSRFSGGFVNNVSGPIDVYFKMIDSAYSYLLAGVSTTKDPVYTTTISGTYRYSSASAIGNILQYNILDNNPFNIYIYDRNQSNVSITRNLPK